MKQVFLTDKGIKVEEVPAPICRDTEVLVVASYSVISSGTETISLHKHSQALRDNLSKKLELVGKVKNKIDEDGFKQTFSLIRDRITAEGRFQHLEPTGYSLSGIIIEKGRQVKDLNVRDRVACGGSEIASHAEIVSVPRNLVARVPDGVTDKEAAFATLGSIAMHGVRRAQCQFGETVVIMGLGILGLLAIQIALAGGYEVIGIDLDESRVMAAGAVGANLIVNSARSNAQKAVYNYTKGIGADAVVLYAATQSSEPLNQALTLCRKKGRVVIVGNVGMDVKRELMYKKELDIMMSTSYGPGRYDKLYEEKGMDYPIAYVRWTENRNMEEFLNMVSKKKVDLSMLISLEFPIDQAPKAYEAIMNPEARPLGVVLNYPHCGRDYSTANIERKISFNDTSKSTKSTSDSVNIAVIGAGGFSQRVHLPILKKINGYNLRAVVNQHGERAKMVAKRFDVDYATTDYMEVLADKNIDAVLVATRHNLHAPIILEAARAGKDIFTEKPMALDSTQLNDIKEVLHESGVKFTVGLNRRYSPLSVEAKKLLSGQERPYLINYRVNAGFVPKDSWVQDPNEGGGRIIGECCHFFDLFNFLIDSDIEEIDAKSIAINNKNIVEDDNFVATIKYKDGSLAILTYVSLGNKSLYKERMEIFSTGSSMVINDFEKLELYGFNQKNVRLKEKDKGHYNQLIEFLKLAQGRPSMCLTLEQAALASDTTFKVADIIRNSN